MLSARSTRIRRLGSIAALALLSCGGVSREAGFQPGERLMWHTEASTMRWKGCSEEATVKQLRENVRWRLWSGHVGIIVSNDGETAELWVCDDDEGLHSCEDRDPGHLEVDGPWLRRDQVDTHDGGTDDCVVSFSHAVNLLDLGDEIRFSLDGRFTLEGPGCAAYDASLRGEEGTYGLHGCHVQLDYEGTLWRIE